MRIKILYEDQSIIVVHKPPGLATETSKFGQIDMVSEIKNYIASKGQSKGEPYLGLIHRLDQPVEGILVVAKNQKVARELSQQIRNNLIKKYYYGVVFGNLKKDQETLVDFLLKDSRSNLSKIVKEDTIDAKRAELSYQIISCETEERSNLEHKDNTGDKQVYLVEVQLVTGRHHQIRVQMSNAGIPLLGDLKYGSQETIAISEKRKIHNIALCAYKLQFINPATNKKMEFKIEPSSEIFHNLIS
ncbi:MAG TPA: RluA family pseudouridine synthase [Lachnospiraceae bacterium]|nr:RluA family pseudouridine synthase [Lachnospiraceae bacterium]